MVVQEARAIVTGAARGLGRHFALELVREGARVVAGDVDRAGLRRLENEARFLPGELSVDVLDVADAASVEPFVRNAANRLGGINVLINNAGVLLDGLLVSRENGRARKLPSEQWERVLGINLTGPFLMAREVAAHMTERQGETGVILNISSLARAGHPGQASYSASKAGLDAATRAWALELAPQVRVASIAPGVIDTPILENVSPEALEGLVAAIPLGRIGKPEDVWLAVRFVLACDFFTGRVIEVDGGASMS